jgi:AraC family transcriptional regulator
MDSIGKALWFIESHFADDIALDDVAAVAGVSRFHLSRAFGHVTGQSVMRYVRGRRLSGAARALSDGAPDILAVALDAGYGSHEAFTRAFRDQFGLTPEAVRVQRHTGNLLLVEPITMTQQPLVQLDPPRFVDGKSFIVAGLAERFTYENRPGIPALWQRFVAYLGHVPGQVGHVTYGIMHGDDETGFDYMAGVEVSRMDGLPAELTRMRLEARRYVVFTHKGHISTIAATMQAIWSRGLAEAGIELDQAPGFERYGETFDSQTGVGGVEVWLPAK